MSDSRALTPNQVREQSKIITCDHIPDVVFEVVNELLLESYRNDNSSIIILQNDIIDKLINRNPEWTRNQIFDNKYLDFEMAYRKQGWKVFYDKPAYYEDYEPRFEFKRE